MVILCHLENVFIKFSFNIVHLIDWKYHYIFFSIFDHSSSNLSKQQFYLECCIFHLLFVSFQFEKCLWLEFIKDVFVRRNSAIISPLQFWQTKNTKFVPLRPSSVESINILNSFNTVAASVVQNTKIKNRNRID